MNENNTHESLLTVNVYEDRVTINGDDVHNPSKIVIDVNEVREDAKIHEGDIVKIINSGKMYTTNLHWIAKNITDKEQMIRFAYGETLTYGYGEIKGKRYKVIKIVDNIAFIERIGSAIDKCYLIELEGLAKC